MSNFAVHACTSELVASYEYGLIRALDRACSAFLLSSRFTTSRLLDFLRQFLAEICTQGPECREIQPQHVEVNKMTSHQKQVLLQHDVVGATSGGDPVPGPPFMRRGRAV